MASAPGWLECTSLAPTPLLPPARVASLGTHPPIFRHGAATPRRDASPRKCYRQPAARRSLTLRGVLPTLTSPPDDAAVHPLGACPALPVPLLPALAPPPDPPDPTPERARRALDLDALLRDRFGIPSFRPWQREAIEALLGKDRYVLVVAPTGGGKSLCYQLPAVALEGTTLVLSPLISLMEDQVRALEGRGIPATFVASTLPREENGRRLAGMRRGAYKIVYAAPERLAFEGFLDALAESRLALVAVDEAHCIVQWGHDFRPDYLRIGAALDRLRPPRVLACTATATPDARDEIILRMGWRVPGGASADAAEDRRQWGDAPTPRVILRGFARPNLHLMAHEVDGPREAAKWTSRALTEALGSPRRSSRTGGSGGAGEVSGAGIVYAATRKSVERLAEALRKEGWNADAYHAGLPSEVRARISGAFADRSLSVVVATNAFGMGIDRPDVRVVVHAQPPSSIEAYYQEVGRAGRDGAPAAGLLLFAPGDIALRRRLCQLGPDGGEAPPEDAERAWDLFRELLRYVDAGSCRHDFILRYFGDEAESLGGCGHCDVCAALEALGESDPDALARDNDLVIRALSGVARAKGAAGMQLIASMLVGEDNPRLRRLGLDRLSTFGVLQGRSHADAMTILRVLLANGWIDLTDSEFPVPHVTHAGWRVMRKEVPARVRLPLAQARRKARVKAMSARTASASAAPARATATASASVPATSAPAAERVVERLPDQAADEVEERDVPLYEALRAHRAAIAREKKVPPYVVAHDRTLRDIARIRPISTDDLELARGMGPAKIKQYGEGLLQVVRDFAGR